MDEFKPKFKPEPPPVSEPTGEVREDRSICWGEGNPTRENHTIDYLCANQECHGFLFSKHGSAVGVKLAPWDGGDMDCHMDYAKMVECQKCFTVSWFHIKKSDAMLFYRDFKRSQEKK